MGRVRGRARCLMCVSVKHRGVWERDCERYVHASERCGVSIRVISIMCSLQVNGGGCKESGNECKVQTVEIRMNCESPTVLEEQCKI